MTLFACCCAPIAHSGGSEKVSGSKQSPAVESSAATGGDKPEREGGKRVDSEAAGAPVAAPPHPPPPQDASKPRLALGSVTSGRSAPEQETDDARSCISSRSAVSAAGSVKSLGTQSSIASEFIQERIPARQRETSRVQQAMKTFVRTMVRGRQMGVVSPDGQMRTCSCSLDKRLKHFVIELKSSVRQIPLAEMAEVYQGTEPEDIDTPLDELCATLTLESGECITFHFDDIPAREHFAMCLQVLVDGQR